MLVDNYREAYEETSVLAVRSLAAMLLLAPTAFAQEAEAQPGFSVPGVCARYSRSRQGIATTPLPLFVRLLAHVIIGLSPCLVIWR